MPRKELPVTSSALSALQIAPEEFTPMALACLLSCAQCS